MIKTLDQELTKRVNKAIINIRLIASRVKRASLQDAMQRCETVVTSLDSIRKYFVALHYDYPIAGVDTAFKHDGETMLKTLEAVRCTDIIYKMLTRQKQASYKEEIKQVKLLYVDVIEYLETILREIDENATK